MRKLSTILLLGSLILVASCSKPEPPPQIEVSRPAKLFTVTGPDAMLTRSFPGEVRASETADLAFRVRGRLIELNATRGSKVEAGQTLARLDPADYAAAVEQAQAQFELARAQFNRAAELIDRQLISQADYDRLLAQKRVAEADLTKAKNNLEYTHLVAPFDGVIATRQVENFENVMAGQVVMVLQTEQMIDIQFNVPESIVRRVERTLSQNEPQPLMVRFGDSENTYQAKYKEHESNADPATLTFRVTVSMPQPEDINVLPGMSATVIANLSRLFSEQAEAYTMIPIEAVFSAETEPLEADKRQVWVVDPETMRASRRDVDVGILTGDQVVIREGLKPGDVIVAAGVNGVKEGMLLREMVRERGL